MLKYIIKRILLCIPVLFFAVSMVFLLMRIIPGNPVYSMVDINEVTQEEIHELEEKYGLNDSIVKQYVSYLAGMLKGDFGISYFNDRPVFENIFATWEPTIMITLLSTFITVFVCIPAGIYCATHRNSILDYTISTVSIGMVSIPSFWLGMMLLYVFSFKVRLFPVAGYREIARFGFFQALYSVLLPSLALGLHHVASLSRQTRSAMLDVLGQDYIRTAKAKGLSLKKVNYKHALKNTLSIVATVVVRSFAAMLGGSSVTEQVFTINGMGTLALNSLNRRDYSQEQAIILFTSFIFLGVNLVMDIVYKLLDPRIEYN